MAGRARGCPRRRGRARSAASAGHHGRRARARRRGGRRAGARARAIPSPSSTRSATPRSSATSGPSRPTRHGRSSHEPEHELRHRVRREWKRLRRRAAAAHEATGAAESREALHEVRKAAKRLRYAAESLVPSYGDDAARLARRARRIQTDARRRAGQRRHPARAARAGRAPRTLVTRSLPARPVRRPRGGQGARERGEVRRGLDADRPEEEPSMAEVTPTAHDEEVSVAGSPSRTARMPPPDCSSRRSQDAPGQHAPRCASPEAARAAAVPTTARRSSWPLAVRARGG